MALNYQMEKWEWNVPPVAGASPQSRICVPSFHRQTWVFSRQFFLNENEARLNTLKSTHKFINRGPC